MNAQTMKNDERISLALRSLYAKYGYARYKMSKFEEYDLYVRNKDFLISDSVITFTDTNGRLMALKPDVTLSIVKNSRDMPGYVQKLYYNENVYRVSSGAHSFREIVQLGLECLGDIDDYCIFEVLQLAAESLRQISDQCVLNISHLGVISALLEGVNADIRRRIIACIREKNVHELAEACSAAGIGWRANILSQLVSSYGRPDDVLPRLRTLLGANDAVAQLETLAEAFRDAGLYDMLRIDFSVINDVNYYNGIVFKGFIEGVPTGVLSGGQYDMLMRKMGRASGAIGFAVYLDTLERLHESVRKYDVDVALIYDDASDINGLRAAIAKLSAEGMTVTAQRSRPEKLRFRRLARYSKGEVTILEDA